METFDLSTIGAAGRLVLGAIFLVAGASKMADRHAGTTVERTALRDLLPTAHRAAIWRLVGVVEVGAALLATAPLGVTTVFVLSICVVGFAYAVWAWRWRPQRPCGCFGSASRTPADARTAARALLMLVLASAGLSSPATWWDAVAAPLFSLTTVASVFGFLALSPEVHALRTRPTRCLRGYPAERRVALELPASAAWQRLARAIEARTPVASWSEGCVVFLAFVARVAGQPAFAVFAIGMHGPSSAIRGALVDGRGNMLEAAEP